MNRLQRHIVVWTCVILAISFVFVPYEKVAHIERGTVSYTSTADLGYSTIFAPSLSSGPGMGGIRINYQRIVLQGGAVLLLAIAVLVRVGRKEEEEQEQSTAGPKKKDSVRTILLAVTGISVLYLISYLVSRGY